MKGETKMTYSANEMNYRMDINNRCEDYRISKEGFVLWLENHYYEKQTFLYDLTHENAFSVFDIACDFSIPVIMVKYFRNHLNQVEKGCLA